MHSSHFRINSLSIRIFGKLGELGKIDSKYKPLGVKMRRWGKPKTPFPRKYDMQQHMRVLYLVDCLFIYAWNCILGKLA